MHKLKSTLPNMVIVLGLITAISSFLLAYVYIATKGPIEKIKIQKLKNSVSSVVPGCESFKEYKVAIVNEDGTDSLTFFDAFKNDEKIGTAVMSYGIGGFNGTIKVLVGFDNEGRIIKSLPFEQSETPGLGDKMERNKSNFALQFDNIDPSTTIIKVKKDGGNIDAITAATISSRAYCRAIKLASDAYFANEKKGDE